MSFKNCVNVIILKFRLRYRGLNGIWLIFLSLFATHLLAQEVGSPLIRNYSFKEYKAGSDNYAIIQDNRGVMYFGNNRGILEYDGATWRLIPTQHRIIRGFSQDSLGTVYGFYSGGFGYLAPNDKGFMEFQTFEGQFQKYGSIRDVLSTREEQFFAFAKVENGVPNTSLIRWQNGIKQVFNTEGNFWQIVVNNQLYLHKRGVGLCKLNKDKFELAAQGQFLADTSNQVFVILPYGSHKMLIGTYPNGFFVYDTRGQNNIEAVQQLPTDEIYSLFMNNNIKKALYLPNGNFAFSAENQGIIIASPQGRIIQRIDQNSSVQDDYDIDTYPGEESLWIALTKGISRTVINSPISLWGETNGLRGVASSLVRFENKLYVATTRGVFYLENGVFNKVAETDFECWSLLVHKAADGTEKLILGCAYGLYEIQNSRAVSLQQELGNKILGLYPSKVYPNRIYSIFAKRFVGVFENKGGLWQQNIVDSSKVSIRNFVEDAKGRVWTLANDYTAIICMTFGQDLKMPKMKRYEKAKGLPELKSANLMSFDGELYVSTAQGFFEYSPNSDTFIKSQKMQSLLPYRKVRELRTVQDAKGNLWINGLDDDDKKWLDLLKKQPDGSYVRDSTSLKIIADTEIWADFYPESDGVTWIGGAEGVFRYDSRIKKNYKQPFRVLIREVRTANDSVLFGGAFYSKVQMPDKSFKKQLSNTQPPELMPELSYSNNSLSFAFAAPFFDDESGTRYQYFLEGYDKNWSAWSSITLKEYTNLPEGKYVFKVRAINIYNTISEEALFSFEIMPPWYRTIPAYLCYIICFIVLLSLSVNFYSRRLLKEKIALEKLVKDRTAEVVKKSDELEVQYHQINTKNQEIEVRNKQILAQSHLLERKNIDITASINYAKRIQEAILPTKQKIGDYIPNFFILFKPRDIVSGDFYWFTEVNNELIIAAVDCTGHGVPGAFMSLIANDLLNDIVEFKGIRKADQILNELHLGISKALKQKENDSRDGMDMSLCVVSADRQSLQFAGAKSPLLYFQNQEMFEIRGDKMPIGGAWDSDEQVREFTAHHVPLTTKTTLYLASDGYEDQFGGPENRKYMRRRLKEHLQEIHKKDFNEQYLELRDTFVEWMGKHPQIDDILIFGFEIG